MSRWTSGRQGSGPARTIPTHSRQAIFVLAALAVAQPLFDQLAGNPEFLWLHDLRRIRLWVLILAIFVGVPALLILLAEAAGRLQLRLRRPVYLLWIGLGVSLLTLVALRRLASQLSGETAFLMAVVFGSAGAWLFVRFRVARGLVEVLAWVVWLVPLFFLLHPELRALQLPRPQAEFHPGVAGRPIPVVLVVWDELPVSTLMSAAGEIDPHWFPGFARLAETSTWFRDTLTASTVTSQAIPALLCARPPDDAALGDVVDGRDLFQLLATGHRRVAYSHTSGILPPSVERLGDASRAGSWLAVAADLRLLYLHLTMPAAIRRSLPPVSTAWGEFGQQLDEGQKLDRAIEALGPAAGVAGEPLFVYLHSGLPHHPWIYLPSGTMYAATDHFVAPGLSGVADSGHWMTQPWPVIQAYQRHVLQTMFADRMLARLVKRLEELNLWDEALVIVTADHGASFSPGQPLRIATDANVAETSAVPLFVKLPGQTQARVDDRRASTLDIVPTIAEVLGLEPPWPMEGRSLAAPREPGPREPGPREPEPTVPGRLRLVHHPSAPTLAVQRDLLAEILAVVRTRRSYFANSAQSLDPFRIGPYSDLIGRSLDGLRVRPLGEGWSAELARSDLAGPQVAARLHFEIVGLPGLDRPTAFGLALHGSIAATTALFPGQEPELWLMLNEAQVSLQDADMRILRITVDEKGPRLEDVPMLQTTRYHLSPDEAWIVADNGERWQLDPLAFRGEVQPVPIPSEMDRVLAWSVDNQDRAPVHLVVLSGDHSIATARAGIPRGDFLDYLTFSMPEDHIFYAAFPPADDVRYFVLGADGRASELTESPPS